MIVKFIANPTHKYWSRFISYLRTNISGFSMLFFILLYVAISIKGRLNIGFRHLFPILPFIYILVAASLANLLKNKTYHHKTLASFSHNSPEALALSKEEIHEKQQIKIFSITFLFLIIYLILGTVSAYPNYMSYFNETVGGPKNGYRYVTDSNADWGQDLKRFVIFLDEHPEIDKIRLDYFGMANPQYYLGDKYIMWWPAKKVEAGWYAISTEFLEQSIYDTTVPDSQSYRWLKNKKPLYQVGTSILIYSVTAEEANSINKN